MKKLSARLVAEVIFLIHAAIFLIALFGWLMPPMRPVYIAVLIGTIFSNIVFQYCFLSKWEFDFRKIANPKTNYDYAFASHYTHKLTNHRMSNTFFQRAALVFLVVSLAANLYAYA